MRKSRVFASFGAAPSVETLPELCVLLLRDQGNSWPQLIEGYEALKMVRVREVQCDGYSVFLQYNPRRIVSSGAKVDPQTIRRRRCFLCVDNLPSEQKGVLYKSDFLILCNPAPILDQHLTITHVRHIPQQLEGYIPAFLELSRDLAQGFTVFYNGPRCGASAPDHMHFQAGPAGAIPIEKESEDTSKRRLRKTWRGVSVYTLTGLGRRVLLLEGEKAGEVESMLDRWMQSMKKVLGISEEPMVNILCSYTHGMWRLILFPRRKHRPEVYFREGDARVLISPASVDMGGLVVTPVEKDFLAVDAAMIQSIFNEVSLEENTVDKILGEL